MKTTAAKTELQKQEGILQMARLRVEIAESRWEETKEQAREARRKRKEAKAIARQAKKESKQAKAELAEARSFLADIEAKLAPPTESVPKVRKGRVAPSGSVAASVSVAQEPTLNAPENEASTDSGSDATAVEKKPESEPRGIFGNWR